jgi:hypothetical protein
LLTHNHYYDADFRVYNMDFCHVRFLIEKEATGRRCPISKLTASHTFWRLTFRRRLIFSANVLQLTLMSAALSRLASNAKLTLAPKAFARPLVVFRLVGPKGAEWCARLETAATSCGLP